jgi:hypothetical protein
MRGPSADGVLPWALLVTGSAASLAANVAVTEVGDGQRHRGVAVLRPHRVVMSFCCTSKAVRCQGRRAFTGSGPPGPARQYGGSGLCPGVSACLHLVGPRLPPVAGNDNSIRVQQTSRQERTPRLDRRTAPPIADDLADGHILT